MADNVILKSQDLVLAISRDIDPNIFDVSIYFDFINALCRERYYQKEAIINTVNYLLGGKYRCLRDLAEENYLKNEKLKLRHKSFKSFESNLHFPEKLSCTLDLATGTGKSFVLYGIARILLAEGVVDKVLVLCPSLTIEAGLKKKFQKLSSEPVLRNLLPTNSKIKNPSIISGNETIVDGSICIENYHAILSHVNSSIRDSLFSKGERTLILNDEVHHVYNSPIGRNLSSKDIRKWKEFLNDPHFNFKYLVGVSGTCYINNNYFSDVIYRYSLRSSIEDGHVKSIEYVCEDTSQTQLEKFQKIYKNHQENKNKKYYKIKPLTILITRDISSCKRVTKDLIDFIADKENIEENKAKNKVLIVTSLREHKKNIEKLDLVDSSNNPIEWITSVSMLTEGWDVNNVFQIVPHEERAFNSKLLIAQVLGRGLRVPEEYKGEHPVLTIFNHDSWSRRIKHLVDEIIEIDKRIYSYPVEKNRNLDFTIHQIRYGKPQVVQDDIYSKNGEYDFSKGFINLASQIPEIEKETVYERAVTGERISRKTLIKKEMHSVDKVAESIYFRFCSIDLENDGQTEYSKIYSLDWIRNLINRSIDPEWKTEGLISEENRQRIYRAFNVIHRPGSKVVRYKLNPESIFKLFTKDRPKESVGFNSLRNGDIKIFIDNQTRILGDLETIENLKEALDDWNLQRGIIPIENENNLKTSLLCVLANHQPEYKFIQRIIKPENSKFIDSWIKSTEQGFYQIEYGWRKGKHTNQNFFNPDFFIKINNEICVIEIKSDDEIKDPSSENKGKFLYAKKHFDLINDLQHEQVYNFHFLSPKDYENFFQFIRDGKIKSFRSELDLSLENGSSDI